MNSPSVSADLMRQVAAAIVNAGDGSRQSGHSQRAEIDRLKRYYEHHFHLLVSHNERADAKIKQLVTQISAQEAEIQQLTSGHQASIEALQDDLKRQSDLAESAQASLVEVRQRHEAARAEWRVEKQLLIDSEKQALHRGLSSLTAQKALQSEKQALIASHKAEKDGLIFDAKHQQELAASAKQGWVMLQQQYERDREAWNAERQALLASHKAEMDQLRLDFKIQAERELGMASGAIHKRQSELDSVAWDKEKQALLASHQIQIDALQRDFKYHWNNLLAEKEHVAVMLKRAEEQLARSEVDIQAQQTSHKAQILQVMSGVASKRGLIA